MAGTSWTDAVQAVGAILIPVVVAGTGYVVSRSQSRNDELLKVRLGYYQTLAPPLNQLMCYLTFIGTWRDTSPPEVIQLKRQLDGVFFCAAPLFTPGVLAAYVSLMNASFETFGDWGVDAKIRSNAFRRRQSWSRGQPWDPTWDSYFTMHDSATVTAEELRSYRETYDALIGALVRDLQVTRTRAKYTTDEVSLNAQAPQRVDITGAQT